MASIAMFGGGFFFSPFTYSGRGNITLGAIADTDPSAWTLIFGGLPANCRWANIEAFDMTVAAANPIQLFLELGKGAVGAETPFFPTFNPFAPPNGIFSQVSVAVQPTWYRQWSFPVSLAAGELISVRFRCFSFAGTYPIQFRVQMIFFG